MNKYQNKNNNNVENSLYYRRMVGVPKGNILDLRQTQLGRKELEIQEKEDKREKRKKEVKKEEFTREKKSGWFSQLFHRTKIKKTVAKDIKKEDVVINIEKLQIPQPVVKPTIKKVYEKVEEKPAPKVEYFERPPDPEIKYFSPWKLSFKPLLSFFLICLMLVLPIATFAVYKKLGIIKNSVFELSAQALDNIKVGSELAASFNFTEASGQFNNAFNKFNTAQTEVESLNEMAGGIIELIPGKGEEFKSAKNLLDAATYISDAATDLTAAFDIFQQIDKNVLESVDENNTVVLTDVIVLGHSKLEPASEKIDKATALLEDVNPDKLPKEYQEKIIYIKRELPKINNSLKQVLTLSEAMLTILGHDQPKRYLVVFQNNREIRATGGFLGSFGLIDISKGKVSKIVIPSGGTYDLNGALKKKIISPEPLHLINPAWQIQDANWWPDWPTSAQKIEWFYNQSNGPTVDGVLSLTPDIIIEMLKITGPIDMTSNYGVTISADNFYQVTQTEAEKKYDETRESKKIIADLTPKLLDKLFSLEKDNALEVLEVFYNSLRNKHILLYFNDPDLENEMLNLGWSGEIKETKGDYLSVINTNIGGGKTDAVIEEIINHQAKIESDGSIIDTVSITRTHKGSAANTLTNSTNWDYLRLYVPEGSEFIEASGFKQPDKKKFFEPEEDYIRDTDLQNISGEVYVEENTKMRINKEFGKTVFSNWVELVPGNSVTVSVTYRLPLKLNMEGLFSNIDTYSLFVQKQPGSFDSLFNSEIIYPTDWQIKWQYPKREDKNFSTPLDTDKYFGQVFAKDN